ncbi:MAG: site-specific integrase [Chitinophagaceae bacterium]|nr:site-specific integrase [Oligoflexus sp.]
MRTLKKSRRECFLGGSAKFNIPLLLALLSINKPSYATYCDILQELMLGKQDLPAFKSLSAAYDYIYGEIWLPFISHRKQNNGILILDRIAGSTAKTRTDVLVELFRLASMPILSGCFPSVYTGISESLKPSFKNELEDLNRLGELNAVEPIRPLSFLELEKAAQEICKLQNKRIIVQFLIFLTFGFRKSDGLSLRFDDMSSAGEIQMNEVEKKNRKRRAMSGKKLHPHQSTFDLACLLAFQDNLRLSLHPNDKRLINKPIQDFGFSIRALRTTAAVALIKSGATIEEIQRRLGHTTLKMIVDRYTHEMLPGEKRGQNIDEYFDLSPPDTRNPLKGGIVVGGNQLWNLEYFSWDRYVHGLCLRLISEHFDPDEWIKFKDILFAELDFRTKKVAPISAAKKGMRFD